MWATLDFGSKKDVADSEMEQVAKYQAQQMANAQAALSRSSRV